MEDQKVVKLKPSQRKFFERFARNSVINTTLLAMSEQGIEVTEQITQSVTLVVEYSDVKVLTEAIATYMLGQVDFKVLTKVEAFLTSEDARKAMRAAQDVGDLVLPEILSVMDSIFEAPPAITK